MKENDNQELIEKIINEVKDPQLRDQLLQMVSERGSGKGSKIEIFEDIGINPDGIRKNIVLSKWVVIAIGLFLFGIGFLGLLFDRGQFQGAPFFYTIWIVFVLIAVIVNLKFKNNLLSKKKQN